MRDTFLEALLTSLLALSMVAGAANAQNTTPPAEKKTTPAKKPPATPPKPDLEPKAVELLKAVERTIGCCAYPVVHSGATLRVPEPRALPCLCNKDRRHSTEA